MQPHKHTCSHRPQPWKSGHVFGTKHLSLMVDATKKCQLGCTYCYFGEKARCDMDPQKVIAALKNFTALFPELKSMSLHFMGGEPLLAWDKIVPLVSEVREHFESKQVHFSWGLTSNLIGLDQKKADYMKSTKGSIHCSVDGPPEIHNTNRPFVDGSPSYEAVVRNVERALSVNPNDTARVTILPDGGKDCVTIASFILSLGFKHVGLFPATGPTIDWTDEAIDIFAASYAEAFTKSPILEDGSRAVSGIMRSYVGTGNREYFGHCGAGKGLWAFGVDGALYHCHHFTNEDGRRLVDPGASSEEMRVRILESEFSPTEKLISIPESCRSCSAFAFCTGGCWATNVSSTSDSNTPDPIACKMNRAIVPLIGDLIRKEAPKRQDKEAEQACFLFVCRCDGCDNQCIDCVGCTSCDSYCQECDNSCRGPHDNVY